MRGGGYPTVQAGVRYFSCMIQTPSHASSGELAWSAGDGTHSYCSTQLSSVGGSDQLLIVADHGLTAFEPAGGKVLWNYEWQTDRPPRVAQPAVERRSA